MRTVFNQWSSFVKNLVERPWIKGVYTAEVNESTDIISQCRFQGHFGAFCVDPGHFTIALPNGDLGCQVDYNRSALPSTDPTNAPHLQDHPISAIGRSFNRGYSFVDQHLDP